MYCILFYFILLYCIVFYFIVLYCKFQNSINYRKLLKLCLDTRSLSFDYRQDHPGEGEFSRHGGVWSNFPEKLHDGLVAKKIFNE